MSVLMKPCEIYYDYEPGCLGQGDHPDIPEQVHSATLIITIGCKEISLPLPDNYLDSIMDEIDIQRRAACISKVWY